MSDFNVMDYIDYNTLMEIQEPLAEMMGIAAGVCDQDGRRITVPSNRCDFCKNYMSNNDIASARCRECSEGAIKKALETGETQRITCHAGLLHFAAPVIVEGKIMAVVVGGEITTETPDIEVIENIASYSGLPFDGIWEAVNHVNVWSEAKVQVMLKFVDKMTGVLGKVINGRYQVMMAAAEMEKAANMRSDFLANMSHEIRTPMNAVIGMAEMALREDLPPAARENITQIKSSGKALLGIINDILDYSKIDSGKMDVVESEYEVLSILNDVGSMISTRLRDKNVELILDINPSFPSKIYGDSQRIRQVLINLVNNAVKFTNRGYVRVTLDYENLEDDKILFKAAVQDSGIGIKEEDLKKLFKSFNQVDSKRNRNVEGTGLGLAISKKLVELMGGVISVDSVYEKGSTFSFELPQKVVDATPTLVVKDVDNKVAFGYFRNKYLARQFYMDLNRTGVFNGALTMTDYVFKLTEMYKVRTQGKEVYVFVDENALSEEIDMLISMYPHLHVIILTNFYSDYKSNKTNIRTMRKPLSSVAVTMALNDEDFLSKMDEEEFEFDFIAPKAKVLIVDDNAINLTVTEGLLEPLKMQVSAASGGKQAIDMIGAEHYDLIFMDHMMPEIDGVEATRIIRRLYKDYDEVPIIALTANAVEGTKEMFLSEGMNDFVAKPIEVRTLVNKVKQWLPIEKIEKATEVQSIEKAEENSGESDIPQIADLDVAGAIKLLGGPKLYMNILKEYYKAIPAKIAAINEYHSNKDWPAYTIEVHALKSSSKQIGAVELSQMAAELEKAGNARDIDFINTYTASTVMKYMEYQWSLAPIFDVPETSEEPKEAADKDVIIQYLNDLLYAIDDLDMDRMDEIAAGLDAYDYDETQKELLSELKDAVSGMDVDACDELIKKWKGELEG